MTAAGDHSTHQIAFAFALIAHILTSLVGFGMLALSGLYGSWGRHIAAPETLRDVRQFFGRANRAGRALWAVPVTGALALSIDHGSAALGQAWVIAATGCWAAATALAVVVIWPAERRIRPVVTGPARPPPLTPGGMPAEELAQLAQLCRPIVGAAAVCNAAFTVALALMVLQPGR